MEYATPYDNDSFLSPYPLVDYLWVIRASVDRVQVLEQTESYEKACKFARDLISVLQARHKNFAIRSFVLALRPHINPYDLGYTWGTFNEYPIY